MPSKLMEPLLIRHRNESKVSAQRHFPQDGPLFDPPQLNQTSIQISISICIPHEALLISFTVTSSAHVSEPFIVFHRYVCVMHAQGAVATYVGQLQDVARMV